MIANIYLFTNLSHKEQCLHLYEGIFMPTSSVQVISPIFLVWFFGLKHRRKKSLFFAAKCCQYVHHLHTDSVGAEQVMSSQIIGDFSWKQLVDAMRKTVCRSGFCGPKTKTMSYKCLIKGKKIYIQCYAIILKSTIRMTIHCTLHIMMLSLSKTLSATDDWKVIKLCLFIYLKKKLHWIFHFWIFLRGVRVKTVLSATGKNRHMYVGMQNSSICFVVEWKHNKSLQQTVIWCKQSRAPPHLSITPPILMALFQSFRVAFPEMCTNCFGLISWSSY